MQFTSQFHMLDSVYSFSRKSDMLIFSNGAAAASGPAPPRYRGFTITLRHTALDRTPLDGRSARWRDLYLTTHSTHKRQTDIHAPAGFEPAIPTSERPQTYALGRAATSIDTVDGDTDMYNYRGWKWIYHTRGLRVTCFPRGRNRIWFCSLRVTVDENWRPPIMCVSYSAVMWQ
jgi:hypothetical protein